MLYGLEGLTVYGKMHGPVRVDCAQEGVHLLLCEVRVVPGLGEVRHDAVDRHAVVLAKLQSPKHIHVK